ncbi:hypothetical protein GW796_06115 [archaeon]|nr:hypothetical protein [archaeon]
MKYLFIDFDGVSHGEETNNDFFTHSKMFCDYLFQYKKIFRIVTSSSWRETYDFEFLVEAFEPSLQDIVLGITPVLDNGGRYCEIIEYCKTNNIELHQ